MKPAEPDPFHELLEASDALLDIVLRLNPQMTYEDPPGLVRACERVAVIIGRSQMTSRRSSRRPKGLTAGLAGKETR